MILCSYSIFLLQLSSMKSRKYVYFIKFNGFWSYKICCVKISISQMSDTKALFLCKLFTFYAVIYFYFTTLIQRTLQSATRHQISFKNMRSILNLFQFSQWYSVLIRIDKGWCIPKKSCWDFQIITFTVLQS